ncbi:spore coat protein [Alicyclobacillus mengziensis]|uniref:Spore coat protein n=1 Tax=Alicyclobacillus mengziensis TaxID=2931921 RepID=A0A9X7Z8L0_9BACL|nr:spore coat protein [Alicyclobacillus mengziensis]QSO48331.1 spore coat protein [Alicyclobacillus mengziensis]
MPLSTHEVAELNELTMSCVNTINSMGLFLNQVKCQELKGIIEKQLAAHIQDYNIKVEWIEKGSSSQKLAVPSMPTPSPGGTHKLPQAMTPNPKTTTLDDRAIATSYLLTLKRAGREYAWATFETGNPQLRAFLEDAFTMASHHAFEIGEYMAKRGYYPSEEATTTYVNKVAQTYEPVREMAGVH